MPADVLASWLRWAGDASAVVKSAMTSAAAVRTEKADDGPNRDSFHCSRAVSSRAGGVCAGCAEDDDSEEEDGDEAETEPRADGEDARRCTA